MKLSAQVASIGQRVGALETKGFDDSAGVARISKIYGNVRITTVVTALLHQYGLVAAENTALSFDGVDDYVDMGNVFNLSTLTLEAWIKADSIGSTGYIVAKDNPGGYSTSQYQLSLQSNGKIQFAVSGGLSSNTVRVNSTTLISAGTWYHVAGTYDGSNIRVYVNGVFEVSNPATALQTTAQPFRVGKAAGDFFPFPGSIDDVRIWKDVARTQAEIQANMSVRLRGDETGLVGYWNFDEGSDTIALDKTANANNGTITGATYVGRNLALSFDGVDDYVSVPDIAIPSTTSYTLEAWINRSGWDNRSPYNAVIGWGTINAPKFTVSYNNGNETFYFGGWGTDAATTVAFTLNTWFHVAVVVTTNIARLYINGVDAGISVDVSAVTKSIFYFGRASNLDALMAAFVGSIDDVRIWKDVARTQAEIQANMNKRLIGTESGLVGYWKFDEASLTQALDSTANANHGTITGATPTREAPFQEVVSFYTPIASASLII